METTVLLMDAVLLANNTHLLSQSSSTIMKQSYDNFVAKNVNPFNITEGQYWNCGDLGGSNLGSTGNGSTWEYTETSCGEDGVIRPVPSATVTGKYLDVVQGNNIVTITYLEQGDNYWDKIRNSTITSFEKQGYVAGKPVTMHTLGDMASVQRIILVNDK